MKRLPVSSKPTIEDAVNAATEAAWNEIRRLGYGDASASITVSAYTKTMVNSVTLTVGTIPPAQSVGGYARAAALTPLERSAIARKAAKARWGKARDDDDENGTEKEEGQG